MKISLNDPIIVSQAPPDLKSWGPWQFPLLQRLEDGRLLLEYHREEDSAKAYGLPAGQAVSDDDGANWQELAAPGIASGLRLPDGSLLRALQRQSLPTNGLQLPDPLAYVQSSYDISYTYYRKNELPPELREGWWFRRKLAGQSNWVEEQAVVEVPGELGYATEGVFVFPHFEQDRIHLAPDGGLLATLYGLPQMKNGRVVVRRFLATLVKSSDNGRTWKLISTIPYQPDMNADPLWDSRDGFTEPQITYLPDNSMFLLLRTTDGNGVGPLYATCSRDDGRTWEKPWVFDQLGVWPQLLTLQNGVTLVSYGRPGLFLRAAGDRSARMWSETITVVPPGIIGQDTCSYSDLIALSDHEALIAYSDFNVPNPEGLPCKTILVRKIVIQTTG
jgi:hypothetical protein